MRIVAFRIEKIILKSKKILKENLTADPSGDVMNYVKFTVIMAGSIALINSPN